MPKKSDKRTAAGRSARNFFVAFGLMLLAICFVAALSGVVLRPEIRPSVSLRNGEAMAQESKPAVMPRLQDPQVWVGELYAVGSGGEVRYLQAKGSFRTRSECDAWVRRTAESRKYSHYGIAEREVVQAGGQADETWDAINYRDKYNTWAAFCHRAR